MLYQSVGIENTYNNRITSRAGYSWAREYQDGDTARIYRKGDQVHEYQRGTIARDHRREENKREYQNNSIPQDYEHYRQASFEARARAYQAGYVRRDSRSHSFFDLSRESVSYILKLFAIIVSVVVILGAGLFMISSVRGEGILSFGDGRNIEAEEEIEINTDIPVEELSLNAVVVYR